MNISQISYQPKIVNNNQNKQNQSVSFKAGVGKLFVKFLEENKGNFSQEQFNCFVNNNFSFFTRRYIKRLLEKPKKYIAELAASITSLTAAKTLLEKENQVLQNENTELKQRITYFINVIQNNNLDAEITEQEKFYINRQKVCHSLQESNIQYRIDEKSELLTITVEELTPEIIEQISAKLDKNINITDFVETVNGNVKAYNKSIDLGKIKQINGNLSLSGKREQGGAFCKADNLEVLNGNLFIKYYSSLCAPNLIGIEGSCDCSNWSDFSKDKLKYIKKSLKLCKNPINRGVITYFPSLEYVGQIGIAGMDVIFNTTMEVNDKDIRCDSTIYWINPKDSNRKEKVKGLFYARFRMQTLASEAERLGIPKNKAGRPDLNYKNVPFSEFYGDFV